jgi:ribonuclease HI
MQGLLPSFVYIGQAVGQRMKSTVHQLSILETDTPVVVDGVAGITIQKHVWWLYIDGASRNNPGPAAAGLYILKDGVPHYQDGYFLGVRTNNQAEYLSLLLGICTLKRWAAVHDSVHIFSDSQLLVRQILQVYKVKNELLKPLFRLAQQMVLQMRAELSHIPREKNIHADRMANHGLDAKKPVPSSFVTFLRAHEIDL